VVKASRKYLYVFIFFALCAFILSVPIVQGAGTYHIEKQWVKIWINKDDGTIDIQYNLTLVCDNGTISWIQIGQPNPDFTIEKCTNEYGQNLTAASEEDGTGVQVTLKSQIATSQNATVILLTRVDKMVWENEWNTTNVGIVFIPTWWPTRVEDLRIAIVLPGSVPETDVGSTPNPTNLFLEDGNRVVYWNRTDLIANEQFQIAVGFPKQYVTFWYSRSIWDKIGSFLGPVIAVSVILIFVVLVIRGVKKITYVEPKLSMEVLGVRKGLTAVEAAVLLDVDPRKVLTMILFGLLHKNAVEVTEVEPYLRLKILNTANLHHYEIDFLDAVIKSNLISADTTLTGTLSDKKLSQLINNLRLEVDKKVAYYCRADTIAHYRSTIHKAWAQVSEAKTQEVKAVEFNDNLEWLVIDTNFKKKTKENFRGEGEIPATSVWWLPYWFAYHSSPTFRVSETQPPTQPATLPAVQFADAVVTSIESTTNRIVRDIENFTKSILPPPASSTEKRSSQTPVHSGGCVCACASCACACACASCACACASGGAG
jgi:hypothetical protein